MLKLKTILHSKYFIIISTLVLIIYSLIIFNYSNKSSLSKDETTFACTINSYYIKENYLSMNLYCDENIIATKYFNTKEEVSEFINTYNYKDKVEIYGSLEELKPNTNINMFNPKEYYSIKNIYYKLKIKSIKKIDDYNKIYTLNNFFLKRIDNLKSKSYIYSLVLGNKNYMDEEVIDMYKEAGILHMFAISGMHISVITEIFNKIYDKENDRKNKIILITILIYSLIVNTVSIERAFISYLITYFNKRFNLDINKYLKIFLIIISLLFINPKYIYSQGFYMSVIISSFLILLSDKLNSKNILLASIKLSIISFIISFPLVSYYYSEVNLLSFIFNTFSSLIITTIIFPLSILTIFIPIFDYPLYMIINMYEYIMTSLSSLSINLIFKKDIFFVLIYYLLLILSIKNKRYLIIFLIVILIHLNFNNIFLSNYIYFYDVGQGDSILISINNKYTLIDTGGKNNIETEFNNTYNMAEKITIPVLKSLGINKLDNLILSHGDLDHMGESINLVKSFKVDKVIFNKDEYNDLETELIRELDKRNIKYYKDANKVNDLLFLNTKLFDNENDNSNVIYFELYNHKFLFMGDSGIDTEKELIDKYNLKDIDVLKVGHHGSKTSSSKSFIDKINPKYSVISVGKNNKYGHPNKEVLKRLNKSNIFRTDVDGGIMFKIENNELKIDKCVR